MGIEIFIRRPVTTSLLAIAILLAGIVAYLQLPVAPMPMVDFPTISVDARLPGANPETMAATMATPLERTLGRIAGLSEMTSSSGQGGTRISLQFELSRDINGAMRDVQAAINAARAQLPANLPTQPSFRKYNPADQPVIEMAVMSDVMDRGNLYDLASTILAQRISQIPGVGLVEVGGSSLPAVRVELNPGALAKYGVGLEDVRAAINAANVNRPKGQIEEGDKRWELQVNDQARTAADYLPLIVAYREGAPVRLSDLGNVVDSVENLRNAGYANGHPAVVVRVYKQPDANIVATVERVLGLLPELEAGLPAAADIEVLMERTRTIKASLREVEHCLALSVGLVMIVVFLFLRNLRSTLIPSVAIPVSLIGSFAVMYLCGFSLDNLSLMALAVGTGFVVDDAIVVLENISRKIEEGIPPMRAAIEGAREVAPTVISMSLALLAVFLPILLMGGIVGRMFREFAVTLGAAVIVSLVVSVTLTPMLCSRFLKHETKSPAEQGRFFRGLDAGFQCLLNGYSRSLSWALSHGRLVLLLLVSAVGLNVYLYTVVPKGFFPEQDTGRLIGGLQTDPNLAFGLIRQKLADALERASRDPDVKTVAGFTGGGGPGFNVLLKPLGERSSRSSNEVLARLRAQFGKIPGVRLFLFQAQDVRTGGRFSPGSFQYTLESGDLAELRYWTPRLVEALSKRPELDDVGSDLQEKGQELRLVVNRDAAYRLGVKQELIDQTLNDAFGQRPVSVIYNALNQYRVIMELDPAHWQSPEALQQLYVSVPPSAQYPEARQIPLANFVTLERGTAPQEINHHGTAAAATISFNLKPGISLSDAALIIEDTVASLGAPASLHGGFQGTAKAFKESLDSQPWLILTALLAIYVVLGILYESYVHPLTIISTLPSAGVGALLALLVCKTEFSLIAFIGVIMLIGIVKKNAIMMIDYALQAEREQGLAPREAIFAACRMRFRPILMTTLAALVGALPLALGSGDGAEMRQPLGISIVGGLLVSQVLTLYTTPVVYLYLDRFRWWCIRTFKPSTPENLEKPHEAI
ncbi:efflux RND transporter permease subunit [Methylococcus sp. EFPC2]|uniref:efflux RND transporter permease subunit n=1 Tax=Methylococcus sp. EFPC2 TaxID=2812648 RepID=UPI0019681969|nr:efflux RND transporter permease subunit [Methylococcus sp. EFPC2]QSA96130.1 efflux RND transporter permease subunit [Methylococcus sp. EFPC2]